MLADEEEKNIKVLGNSSEKFKSISTLNFQFKDSLNFLKFSLADLVTNLRNRAKDIKDYPTLFPATFALLEDQYNTGDKMKNIETLELLIRKQPFPYVRKTVKGKIIYVFNIFLFLRNILMIYSWKNLKKKTYHPLRLLQVV